MRLYGFLAFCLSVSGCASGSAVVLPDADPTFFSFYEITAESSEEQVKNHFIYDIEPWLVWGKSPQDSGSFDERINALLSDECGRAGFEKYIKGQNGLYDKYMKMRVFSVVP